VSGQYTGFVGDVGFNRRLARMIPDSGTRNPHIFFGFCGTNSAAQSSVFQTVSAGTMVDLIGMVRRWLGPAVPETSTTARDTSSMADLVRLLGAERDLPGAAEAQRDRPSEVNRPPS